MQTPVIVLDFNRKRVLQVLPGAEADERELELALERSRHVTTAGVGSSPPPPDVQDQPS
jgi:hypothetical protein